jgi:hypothetical protein
MGAVVGDGLSQRLFDRLRHVEADVALVEPERPVDRIHHVADTDDAGEGHVVQV